MASNALPETLRSVTSTKIKELKKQRRQYEASKNTILRSADNAPDGLEETRLLLEGICRLEGVRVVEDGSSGSDSGAIVTDAQCRRRNQQLFLLQAQKDPAFSSRLVDDIRSDILQDLELQSIQHEHAQFFSELVTEWLSDTPVPPSTETKSADDSAFESIGRKEMHEQRAQWESIVFSQCQLDEDKISAYLDKLFNTDMVVSHALKAVRDATIRTCETFQSDREFFNADKLVNTVQGLLQTDLLSPEKANVLKSFKTNPDVLQEVADVLNMRFASLHTWEWTTVNGAISIEQRRQLNGKYRVFMDEDVLDALLLHAIGMKFAVHFKACFTSFFNSPAWKSATRQISKVDRDRREYFLGTDNGSGSSSTVEAKRRALYKCDYFLTQLPVSETEGTRGYGDEDDQQSKDSPRKSPIETKQSLLHLLVTESFLARHLRPGASHAVIRSDFQWFGPSLPHETIFACLKFFGVTDHWLQFFRNFLTAPMRFIQDGPDGQFQVRSRGVPMSHALSDVFGEVVLFAMDFAVNSTTSSYLYRLHDDFWFWGAEDLCVRAWNSMTTFASVMGIEFNKEKTGTVVFDQGSISRQTEDSDLDSDSDSDLVENEVKKPGLPKGEVRWGFLQLDAISGQFVIDQGMVDAHIQELKRQLAHCTSIFSYIQAYNAYLARFFSNNFGKPSIAFGRTHVDNMIDTFTRIEKAIFPNQSITDHLNKLAAERFGVRGIPDGVWYWPVQMGGMDLQNPLVTLYCVREHLRSTPSQILKSALEQDELDYLSHKQRFSQRSLTSFRTSRHNFGDTFMARDEYLRYREERSENLGAAFSKILAVPSEFSVLETCEITSWLEDLPVVPRGTKRTTPGISKPFASMKPYWKWILAVYGSQIVEKYGSIQIVDASQVPLGMVSMKKSSKVRWQG